MGCTDSKSERPNFKAYLTTYSFEPFVLREIEDNDLTNDSFFNILRQSYDIPTSIDKQKYKERLAEFKKSSDLHLILIWLDTNEGLIVGTGTLKVEKKFSHNLGRVGKIEDIIIDSQYFNRGLEEKMIQTLMRIAFQEAKAYKVIIEAKEKMVPVYEKLHFKAADKQMIIYDNSFNEIYCPNDLAKEKEPKNQDLEMKDS